MKTINEKMIECKSGLVERFFLTLGPIMLILTILITMIWDLKDGELYLSDLKIYIKLCVLVLAFIFWWIITFSFIPDTRIVVGVKGIESYFKIKLFSLIIVNMHKEILWNDVKRLVWFNSGYIMGYTVKGNSTDGKYVEFGPSIFSTKVIEAVQYCTEMLPVEKVDPIVLKKIEKHRKKPRLLD